MNIEQWAVGSGCGPNLRVVASGNRVPWNEFSLWSLAQSKMKEVF